MFISILFWLMLSHAQETSGYNYYVTPEPFKLSEDPVIAAKQILYQEKKELESQYTKNVYTGNINPYEGEYTNLLSIIYMQKAVPLAEEFSYEKLMDVINSKNITTIEQVISELPEHMKNNHVLMYNSRSLQEGSPTAPRAIVFTPTARFILTFNGGKKSQKGNNTLEMIQFRDDQKRFEFRELTFDGESLPKASEANPRKCLECHQSPDRKDVDPRPNWEPYSTWIGAYGSNNSKFTHYQTLREGLKGRIQPQDKEALDQQEGEYELFKNYVENVRLEHKRYSQLGRPNLHAASELTQQLSTVNYLRVARLIAENKPLAELYKELLMAQVRCVANEKMKWKEQPAIKWMLNNDFSRYFSQSKYEDFEFPNSVLTVAFESINVDTTDWSMDFGNGGRFAFQNRFGAPSVPNSSYAYALINTLPDGKALYEMDCKNLEAIAFKKINAAFEAGTLQQMKEGGVKVPPSGANIVARCISCHVDGMEPNAPALPFDNPAAMAAMLTKPYSARGTLLDDITYRTSDMSTRKFQMPPSRRLSQQEHTALMKYLKEMK